MHDWLKKVEAVAKNPALRPFEVWALRAVLAALAVRLGIDVKSLV
jgi:hypothetical protein